MPAPNPSILWPGLQRTLVLKKKWKETKTHILQYHSEAQEWVGCWDQQACRPQQGGSQSCSASEHRDLGVTHKKICGCWSLVKYKSVTYTRAYKNHLPVAILGSLPVDAVYTALTRCQAPGVSVPEPLSLGILPAVLGERSIKLGLK